MKVLKNIFILRFVLRIVWHCRGKDLQKGGTRMKIFEMPDVNVIKFDICDILTASGQENEEEPVAPGYTTIPEDFSDDSGWWE